MKLCLAFSLGLACAAAGESLAGGSLLEDCSFEKLTPGTQASRGASLPGWEIQRHGRAAILDRLEVECLEDARQAKSGQKFLRLAIPDKTVGFEFVTVGQRARLEPGRVYEASAWVRWPDGPQTAPRNAQPAPDRPSAIVSFWARHRDGHGHFAGRDAWLFDRSWQRLAFRFLATDPDRSTLVYVSLLPNQKPAPTVLHLDDFVLQEVPAELEPEPRRGILIPDAAFDGQTCGDIGPPWQFTTRGGGNIAGSVLESGGDRFVRIALKEETSNFDSAQLWQALELRAGGRYEVSCRMRWDNFAENVSPPIVNYGIYHEPSRTWYGPVDQVLEKTADWRTYRFVHLPPYPGRWKLYVQLNGWGNFGRPVTVSFDDLSCAVAEEPE